MPKGPDYNEKDLAFWAGIFAGIIGMHLALQPYGVHPIITFIGGAIVGSGIGTLLERALVNWQANQRRIREEKKQDDLYGNFDHRNKW